jgi:hypothetical protein
MGAWVHGGSHLAHTLLGGQDLALPRLPADDPNGQVGTWGHDAVQALACLLHLPLVPQLHKREALVVPRKREPGKGDLEVGMTVRQRIARPQST